MTWRALILLAGVALAAPASASAATLGEVPPVAFSGDEWCVHATGLPGEIAIPSTDGMRLVGATKDGLTVGQEVKLGAGFDCGAVAGRPNGAAVIAGKTRNGDVIAAVREPGGTWGAPQVVAAQQQNFVLEVVAGVSDRGDAIVGFKEGIPGERFRFRVARRPAGGAFAAPEQLGATSTQTGSIDVDIAATGEAFALTTTIAGARPPLQERVAVAIAPPGAPFAAPAHVADMPWLAQAALTAGADGRALVAVGDGTSMLVAERAPGAGFGAATPVAPAAGLTVPSVQLGSDGSAAVGWLGGDVRMVTRTALGPFSAPLLALPAPTLPRDYDPFYASEAFLFFFFDPPGGSFRRGDATGQLALTGDGRALFATVQGLGSGSREGASLATVSVAGGGLDSGSAGATATHALPVVLADGTPAVAWTTNTATERYALHLASAATVEPADPATPRVRISQPVKEIVSEDHPLRLPVTCSGPCDVVASFELGGMWFPSHLRLSKAGTRSLILDGAELVARDRVGPVKLELSYGAPGALHPATRALTVRIRRDGPADASVVGLKARRHGSTIKVTWRVTGPPEEFGAFVSGDDTRGWSGEPTVTRTVTGKAGKRNYALTLPAAGVNYVTLRVPVLFLPDRKVVVRVR